MNMSLRLLAWAMLLMAAAFPVSLLAQAAASQNGTAVSGKSDLHRAAATGDLAALGASLQRGTKPDVRDSEGRTPLMDAVAAGQLGAMRMLIAARADIDAHSKAGGTALIEAAAGGRLKSARLLVRAGADLNVAQRGYGTALETAERTGHNDIAAMLLKAGARPSSSSVGQTVCVRPWGGDGYCGTVESRNKTQFSIRVTELVGCKDGCPAKAECSEGRSVGGSDGITVGDEVKTVSWCLTHTGVKP